MRPSQDKIKEVFEANLKLKEYGLVKFTWGNVSALDRETGLVLIKPSGVPYETMTADDIVCVTPDGERVYGKLRPSSDLPTHLVLYRAFPEIGGIVHTHSEYATAFAQCGRGIKAYGTTHADYFYGEVPCTDEMTDGEVAGEYEKNTGDVIVRKIKELGLDPMTVPSVLVRSHGVFSWGENAAKAVFTAAVLEETAKLAYLTETLGQNEPMPQRLLDRHFLRKHGKNAYYGQVDNG